MTELEIGFLLTLPEWPRALFTSEFTYENARLTIDGRSLLQSTTRAELERGVCGHLLRSGAEVLMRLDVSATGTPLLHVSVDGREAAREDELWPRPTGSAWLHATMALAASAAGFVASYLYLLRAVADDSGWALKMANHMAGWHLLLTFTLFPASVWGRRTGIRSVQAVSLLFFLIHLGIALANLVSPEAGDGQERWIVFFNALSGAVFLIATVYGNRPWRDIDPVAALRAGHVYRR